MSKQPITDDFLTLVARLCYVDKLPQQEVAAMVNVSQAKISRLLAMARERGIVQISVSEYRPRLQDLEQELRGRFALQDAIVVKSGGEPQSEQARRMVGHFAAASLAEKLVAGVKVGLAGGRAIQALVAGLSSHPIGEGITVVQLMGNAGPRPVQADASELGRALAGYNHGTFLTLNTPVFAADAAIRDNFLRHEHIRMVTASFKQLDLALVGIGVPGNSIIKTQCVLSGKQIESLERAGVLGDVCGRFFDKNGEESDTEFKDRVVSISFATLRKIPLVYGVVSGTDRAAAIAGAIRGRLVNALVIDEAGARELLRR